MDLLALRGAFPFDPSLGFFGQEQGTSSVNEKPSWALSWTPADLPLFLLQVRHTLILIRLHLHPVKAH